MQNTEELPRWDTESIFPSVEAPEFASAFVDAQGNIAALQQRFDAIGIGTNSQPTVTAAVAAYYEEATGTLNNVLPSIHVINAYLNALISTDSRDVQAQQQHSAFQPVMVTLNQLMTRYIAWIGSLDIDSLISQSELAATHAFTLRQARKSALHLMNPFEEMLATELTTTGSTAWSKLYHTVSSQLKVTLPVDGVSQVVPMSIVRNLAFSQDAEQRRLAYEAELHGWEQVAPVLAASLNSIKGEVNTLTRRRGWATALDEAIDAARIDHETFDAMMTAARESFPDFRRYLTAKARALGKAALPFYDLFAPIGSGNRSWSFAEAQAFIIEQFGHFSPKLQTFVTRAFQDRWIDAEPRDGKRDGAFCMWVRGDESRIMANFKPSFGGMSTLAHELGHGYHNLNLANRTYLQRSTPMTLAETASIFNETLIKRSALKTATREEQIEILQSSLQGACQQIVDITSRFLFEQEVFTRRLRYELSVQELNEIMLQAQRDTYGDGLDGALLHPYMWAAKNHYYSGGRSYYNFPYMFGLLFGTGLYAIYERDPENFGRSYDDLLSMTGMEDAATLAHRFGIDIHDTAFWRASLNVLREDVDRFIDLVGE